tara:strand:+ start:180 stop:383 length:204 start_codon:yes stop_codon:yes gene_type:complete
VEFSDKTKKIKWSEMSNRRIKESLEEMRHESIVVKDKINKLLDTLDDIDKEYLLGNDRLNKRLSGRD